MKKCISILLALVMLVAMLAIPAAASERYVALQCLKCGRGATYEGEWGGVAHYHCDNCNYDFTVPIP